MVRLLTVVCVILPLLVSIAYLTLLERKVLGSLQLRKGPDVVGLYGVLQPLVDGLKLFSKELVLPSYVNGYIYLSAPVLALALALMG